MRRLFPGREVVQAYSENVNRGGGGFNCITQQQPASAEFAAACGWAKVAVDAGATALYSAPVGDVEIGHVSRVNRFGQDVYLERLASAGTRVQVRVSGPSPLDGEIGWVDATEIESAGERCMSVYARN
jgi:hypothetical protein